MLQACSCWRTDLCNNAVLLTQSLQRLTAMVFIGLLDFFQRPLASALALRAAQSGINV